jgi:hypothetical protein
LLDDIDDGGELSAVDHLLERSRSVGGHGSYHEHQVVRHVFGTDEPPLPALGAGGTVT